MTDARRFLFPIVALAAITAPNLRAAEVDATFTSASSVPVTDAGYVATGNTVNFTLDYAPVTGTTLTVVDNTSLEFIDGQFGNLSQGQAVNLSYGGTTYAFVANYFGGTGNDLVLHWADTRAMAWGYNIGGQLGDNSFSNKGVPEAVLTSGALLGKTVIAVAVGANHSLALCSDSTLAAWGDNSSGQLGSGDFSGSSVPLAMNVTGTALEGKTVISVAAGLNHSVALCSDGTVAAWGNNGSGQLGNGDNSVNSLPVAVVTSGVLTGKTVISVAAGGFHTLALCSDGTMVAWGSNDGGALGNGGSMESNVPVAVITTGVLSGKTVTKVAAGGVHSLALCSDGTLAAWGGNNYGQLGDGSDSGSNVPVAVITTGVLFDKTVISVAAGGNHSLAQCSDGTLAAWGWNHHGQLGNGDNIVSYQPVAVLTTGFLSGKALIAVAAGSAHSLALCSDGTVAAWGVNNVGELGNDDTPASTNVPVAVTMPSPPGSRFVATVSGSIGSHSFGLLSAPVPLPSVTTATQSAVTATSATLGGEVTADGGSDVTDHGIVWDTAAAPITADHKVSIGAGIGEFSQVVNDLPAGSTIYVRAYAINSAGTAYGDEISFTTPSDNADLSSLTLSSGALVPAFTPGETSYGTAIVPTTFASVTVTPTRAQADATIEVRVNGGGYVTVTSGNPSGALALNLGVNTIEVRVTAQAGNIKEYTTLVRRNSPPTDISLSNTSISENNAANAVVGTVSAVGDPDPGASHGFTLVTGPGGEDNGSFSLTGNTLRLLAPADFEAKSSYNVKVRADDGLGGIFEKDLVITILDVNEAPSVTNVSASGDEDSPGILVTFSGSDPENDLLTYIASGPTPAEGSLGPINDDTVTFTPAPDFNGVVVFTYKALDGEFESAAATATVTVNAVNDAPTISDIADLSILEDASTGEIAFSISDVDDGDVLDVVAYTDNQALAPDGGLVLGGSGGNRTITVSPEADLNGTVVVTVEVSDGVETATDTFTLTVVAVNDAPSFELAASPIPPGPDPGAEGRLWAWGLNNQGQLGDGSIASAPTPVQVGSQTDWKTVVTGDSYTLGLKSDGTLWAWGQNHYGQLGDGTPFPSDVPLQVGEDGDWKSVSAGDGHVVALKADGTLWAWGRNDYGQLGDASTTSKSIPTQIGFEDDWHAVSAGSLHTLAIKADGSLWAWGRNQNGQLGRGSTVGSTEPVRIGLENGWRSVAAGGLHSAALKIDGTLWSWGRGAEGQIGDGAGLQRTSPVQVGLGTEWDRVAAGYTYTLGLKEDGSLWAWGRNGDGQVGDGTRTNRLNPVQVGADLDWARIAAGRYHALALKNDGSLWTWGDNDSSQMGDGTVADFLSPARLGEKTWSSLAGGLGHSAAVEPESVRLTVAANSGPFVLPGFVTDILAGPLDEVTQEVEFLVTNDNNDLFVVQPAISGVGTLTLEPFVNAGTMTVTVRAKDDGGTDNGGIDTSAPKTFSIVVTVAPEIDLTGNEVPILNGDDTPDIADHTDFEETPTVGGTVVRTFTIHNPGTAPLNLAAPLPVTVVGSAAFSVSAQPASLVVDRLGGTQTFSITFDPATPGLHTAVVSIGSDDEDENPFSFGIAGVGITPEISITGNSVEIHNGDTTPALADHTDFGSTEVVGGSVSRTFTILNSGTQDLMLGGEPLVSLSGSASFTVSVQPTTNPVPKTDGFTTFTILFDPASRGLHSATVTVPNNDEDEAPYTFAIQGVGLAPEITLLGNGNEIVSGDTTPSAGDHTLFGSIGATQTRIFTISNIGNLGLNLTGSPVVGLSGSDSFAVTQQPAAATVDPEGGSVTFEITFDPSAPGVQTATVAIENDDEDEANYTFDISGNGLPKLNNSTFRAVVGNGVFDLTTLVGPNSGGGVFTGPGVFGSVFDPTKLAPGTHLLTYTIKDALGEDLAATITVTVDLKPVLLKVARPKPFGTVTVGTKSRVQRIAIRNLGGETATGVKVIVRGQAKRDFRIVQPPLTVRGGAAVAFRATFAPKASGRRAVKAIVRSANGKPVTVGLLGLGKAASSPPSSGGGGHLPGS